MATFPPKTFTFPSSEASTTPLLFGNATVEPDGLQITPGLQYQAGAIYLPEPWPMSSFGRYGAFDLTMSVLFDEQSGLGESAWKLRTKGSDGTPTSNDD
jgi:hypothetical protein